MKATLIYHLRSGRMVREPAGITEDVPEPEVRDAALRSVAEAMLREAGGGRKELVPLLTVTDEEGRDHIIPTGAIEDVEVRLDA